MVEACRSVAGRCQPWVAAIMKSLGSLVSIRALILCIVLGLGGILGSLTFGNLMAARTTSALAEEAAALAAEDLDVLAAIQALRLERGNTLSILNQTRDQARDLRAVIADHRSKGDQAVKRLVDDTSRDANLTGLSEARTALAAAQADMVEVRRAVDAAMAQDVGARDKGLRGRFVASNDHIVAGLSRMSLPMETRLRQISPESVQLLVIKSAAWKARLAAGNLALGVLAGLTDPRNVSPSVLEGITLDSGRTGAHWSQAAELHAAGHLPRSLADAIDAAQRTYFSDEVGQTLKRLTQALSTGSDPGMTLPEFSVYITPKFGPLADAAMEATRQMVTQATARAEAAHASLLRDALLFVVTLLLAVGGALLAQYRIARPMVRMATAMREIAAGDLGTAVPGFGRRDEIGAMAAAVQVFKDGLVRMRVLEEETVLARASAEEQRRVGMRQMADAFERAVGGVVGQVSAAATELQATAQQMSATASETACQSTSVAAAAGQAAGNVETVATAAEQLGASVAEIGRQVSGASALARNAVSEAEHSARLVQELSGAVSRIGDVVAMISSIASQTNLLALNATIEAARAGEAGRGFAVVAAEVKQLANQTAKATEEISGQIGQIQGATGQAVSAIDGIGARIREISSVAASITTAVQEQGAATQEIVRNVAQAATGTTEVTRTIARVAGAAEETGAASSQVLASASELSRQSEHLSAEVDRFLATVRAA